VRTRLCLLLALFSALLVTGASAHGGGGWDHHHPDRVQLLRANEFGLNFAAGKASNRIYSGILDLDAKKAKIQLGARLDLYTYGACIQGREPNGFGLVNIKRDLYPGGAPEFSGGEGTEQLDRTSAQVLIETKFLEVRETQNMGLQWSALNQDHHPVDFAFVGVVPNATIDGLTAFGNVNGQPVGDPVDFPDTTAIAVKIEQRGTNLRLLATGPGCHRWECVARVPAFSLPLVRVGFGATHLERDDRVYFHDYFARGFVNGLVEQPILEDLRPVGRDLDRALRGLNCHPVNFLDVIPHLTDEGNVLLQVRPALQQVFVNDLVQPNTLRSKAVDHLEQLLILNDRAQEHAADGNSDLTWVQVNESLPVLGRLFADLRGMKISRQDDLTVLLTPHLVLPDPN
jgi:hypothetical protein